MREAEVDAAAACEMPSESSGGRLLDVLLGVGVGVAVGAALSVRLAPRLLKSSQA